MSESIDYQKCARPGCDRVFEHKYSNQLYCDPRCRTLAENARRRVNNKEEVQELELDVDTIDDLDALLAERGMNREDWVIVRVTVNKWEGFYKDAENEAQKVPLRQLKVFLKPKALLDEIVQPARPLLPAVMRGSIRPQTPSSDKPVKYFIYGDDQRPNDNREFSRLKLDFLADNKFDVILDLGDGMDSPTISTHKVNPAMNWSMQECANEYASWLLAVRQRQPKAEFIILADNHFAGRLRDYQLARAEALYGVTPAQVEGLMQDLEPLWSIRRLLHLDELQIKYIDPPGDTHYAESQYEIVPGELVALHGYRTGQNLGKKYIDDYGCSVIYGHDHGEDVYVTDQRRRGVGTRQRLFALGVGCGANVQGGGGFAPGADWQNSALTVTVFPDKSWTWEYVHFANGVLTWRDQHYK